MADFIATFTKYFIKGNRYMLLLNGISVIITLVKETAIVGYVRLVDIQKAGDFIKSAIYETFMPLIGTAIIYFILIKLLIVGLGRLETRLRRSDIR